MSNQTYTPTEPIDMKKERDWAANLGMMDWDSTSIVFTKRSLIEFLKYTGVTVDTNLTSISKLPKYAKFGKISEDPAAQSEEKVNTEAGAHESKANYRPSRRVRTGPGGTSSGLFEEESGDDALSQAPSKSKVAADLSAIATAAKTEEVMDEPSSSTSGIRPSRRVRTAPGGKDSLAEGLWGEEPEFKPTRRVRQGPGGQDSVGGLFG